jgi:crotonobetainyl-CoA:carnitine CoA-transferase CaiB-like acyl-CoA transferase
MRAGFDQIAQGMGGLMWVTGMPGSGPMRAGIAVADSSAGVYAATGILIALAERERSGRGQWVQTSLLEAQIAMMDFQAARYLVDGVVPGQAGNDHPYSTPMGVFETADGFINIGVGGDGQWRALSVALDQPDLGRAAEYATNDMRLRNRPKLTALLADVFKTKSSAQWLDLLEQQGVPAGPIYKVDEVFADPQVEHLGIAVPLHHPKRGDVRVVGQPMTLSRTPARVVSTLPEPGAHSDEILRDIGYSAAEIADFRARRIV